MLNELTMKYLPMKSSLPVCEFLNNLSFGFTNFGQWHFERKTCMETLLVYFKPKDKCSDEPKELGTAM